MLRTLSDITRQMVEPKEGKEVTIDQEDRSGLHNTPDNVNVDIVEDSQPGPSTNMNIEESIMPLRLEVNIKFRWGSKSSCSNNTIQITKRPLNGSSSYTAMI